MITLSILLLIAVSLVIAGVLTLIVGGAGFIVIFADIIIAGAFIVFVVRLLLKK